MSDDERMDRAKRIRNLREGRRGGDRSAADRDSTDAETDDETQGDDAGSSSDTAPDSNLEAEDATGEQPSTTGGGAVALTTDVPQESRGGEDGEKPAGEDSEPEPAHAKSNSGQTAGRQSVAGESDDDTADALAAAAAAAEAAGEFEEDSAAVSQTGAESGAVPQPGEDSAAVSQTEAESLESSQAATESAASEATRAVESAPESAERTRVLEFSLGEERYCLDIEYVEEIVREEAVTRVPNTPEYVSGVVDLRGQITTILDPKTAIGIEDGEKEQLIIVFDGETFDDHGYMGWLVDEVDQVMPITPADVKDSPIQESYINGVIEDDGEFVIWTTPELALDVDEE